jgi:ATP-dependent Lhr-like helicase
VQVELAISRIVNSQWSIANSYPSVWGISATIGNLQQSKEVLQSPLKQDGVIVKADIKKNIEVIPVIPDEIEKYPWAGHLGNVVPGTVS